jgi:hypothetical protein
VTAALLDAANSTLRDAVARRMAATPADDPKMQGYKIDNGDPEPGEVPGWTRLRGDSLMRESAAPGSREWLDALDRLRALHHEKTAQYGGSDDAFENVTASAKCGVEPWRRALCDLSDCVVRMQKYAQGQPVDPTNALLDAANWALICLIKMEEAANSSDGMKPIMRRT